MKPINQSWLGGGLQRARTKLLLAWEKHGIFRDNNHDDQSGLFCNRPNAVGDARLKKKKKKTNRLLYTFYIIVRTTCIIIVILWTAPNDIVHPLAGEVIVYWLKYYKTVYTLYKIWFSRVVFIYFFCFFFSLNLRVWWKSISSSAGPVGE